MFKEMSLWPVVCWGRQLRSAGTFVWLKMTRLRWLNNSQLDLYLLLWRCRKYTKTYRAVVKRSLSSICPATMCKLTAFWFRFTRISFTGADYLNPFSNGFFWPYEYKRSPWISPLKTRSLELKVSRLIDSSINSDNHQLFWKSNNLYVPSFQLVSICCFSLVYLIVNGTFIGFRKKSNINLSP